MEDGQMSGWTDGWKEGRKGGKGEGQGREIGFLIHPFHKYLNIYYEPATVLRAGRKRRGEEERQRSCLMFITIICMSYIIIEK